MKSNNLLLAKTHISSYMSSRIPKNHWPKLKAWGLDASTYQRCELLQSHNLWEIVSFPVNKYIGPDYL